MDNKIHIVPIILLGAYAMPQLFACVTLVALIGALAFIGYIKCKFWYIVARKVIEYKD